MAHWRRLGLVYTADGRHTWATHGAMLPTPLMLDATRARVYVGGLDDNGVSRIGYCELDVRHPTTVLHVANSPALDVGQPGTFDDNGVVPSCVVRRGRELWLYYAAFQLQRQIPYTIFTGCAVSHDDGETFTRVSDVPVLDRCPGELFFRAAAMLLPRAGGGWRAWYIGGSGWIDVAGKRQPMYSLRTIDSDDGVTFTGPGREVLAPRAPEEIGFGRPFITTRDDGFDLHFSIREPRGYRLGFARSADGLVWHRDDAQPALVGPEQGWEQEMRCYSSILETPDTRLMFYNGNGFGRTGFGVAVWE